MIGWGFISKYSILLSSVLAFILVIVFIPTIVKISRAKGLVDEPNGRSSHRGNIPSLGGFAIFTALLISLLFFIDFLHNYSVSIFLTGITVITSIGLKDDILSIAPSKKIIGQLLAGLLLVLFLDVRITSFQGFLGVHELPLVVSAIISLFIIIVITNSINLIDGVDGLAGSIGILASIVYGIWFFVNGFLQQAIMASTMSGALAAFLIFNFSNGKYKIFMGDSGSLLIGYYLAYLTILFSEFNLQGQVTYSISSAPAFAFSVLIIPLFDTLRIIVIRLHKGYPPFKADKRHIHHRLLALLKTHKRVTFSLVLISLVFIILVFLLQELRIFPLLLIQLFLASILVLLPIKRLHRKKPKFAKKNHRSLNQNDRKSFT